MKPIFWTPWPNGIPEAAAYAHLRESEMRRLVRGEMVESRKKPRREDGTRPRGVLVYAPSIDEYLRKQPSGANEIAQALSGAPSRKTR